MLTLKLLLLSEILFQPELFEDQILLPEYFLQRHRNQFLHLFSGTHQTFRMKAGLPDDAISLHVHLLQFPSFPLRLQIQYCASAFLFFTNANCNYLSHFQPPICIISFFSVISSKCSKQCCSGFSNIAVSNLCFSILFISSVPIFSPESLRISFRL